MNRPNYFKEVGIIALVFLPMIYLGIVWTSIPNIFPSNYNIFTGTPERIGERTDFLFLMMCLFIINFGLYALFRYIPRSPGTLQQSDEITRHKYYNIRFRIHFYLGLMDAIVIWMAQRGNVLFLEKWVFIGIGILLATIGFYLRNVPPNNYIGVRTPWTLKSTVNWTLTHHMTSRLWIFSGVGIIIGGLFVPMFTGMFIVCIIMGAIAYWPFTYSYRLYYKEQG
ncbi:hypothetical protein COR50_00690 [Chitinophaga caeni]|uniref:DUF1648 domain-containing protein n=1 Tax=Chitinophaga caeni TaxID=2029983 RepID=A0A291QPI2_9BACT|nr:SdpI family protein [Chitinophaga caeni]ATL45792.1 hypothetical protein COR50_00690 [Chitinophaga caeni]